MAKSTAQKIRVNIHLKEAIHGKFKEICKREGVPMSGKIEEFMLQYVQAHSNGNPQLRISVYAKPEETQPIRVLCPLLDGAVSDGRVHCRRAGMWVPGVRCYSCGKNQLRKQK